MKNLARQNTLKQISKVFFQTKLLASVVSFMLTLSISAQAQNTDFAWESLGETTFANCLACHQANGAGIPSAFPPLSGHTPMLLGAEGGRDYMIKVVLYGLQGEINVLGASYNSVMTPLAHLGDDAIAAVLNYSLHAWDNDKLLPSSFSIILPTEVAALRNLGLSASDILELRKSLDLD